MTICWPNGTTSKPRFLEFNFTFRPPPEELSRRLPLLNYVSGWPNICTGLSLIAEVAEKAQEEVRSFGLKINYKQTFGSLHLQALPISSLFV